MKNHLFIVLLITIAIQGGVLFGEDFQLIFNDGPVEVREGGKWTSLYAGDMVPENSLIRIGSGGIAEFSSSGTTLLFSKPGSYRLESENRQRQNSHVSAVASIFGRMAKIGSEGERGQSQAMGVRGSEAVEDIGFDWVEEDTLRYDEAIAAFENRDYSLAVDILENEVDPLALTDESAYWYYLAASYLEDGKKGPALRAVKSHEPVEYSEVYSEFLLLKGRLSLEASDFVGAADSFEKYIQSLDNSAKQQMGNYLYGYTLLQKGDSVQAREALREAVRINADSEITGLAKELLK